MIIKLSTGKCELVEKDDLRRLKLLVPQGWDTGDIQRGLPFDAAAVQRDHIWIHEVDLRELSSIPPDRNEQDAISVIVNKAKSFGFYDSNSRAIRVHIEHY